MLLTSQKTTLNLPMLRFLNKKIRAKVIKEYVEKAQYDGVVCFSCGNASSALRLAALDCIDVSPRAGDLVANRWWSPAEIRKVWPNRLDATSGHLPMPLMIEIANAYAWHLGDLDFEECAVPTGSGETIICLNIAYPEIKWVAAYNVGPGTEYYSKSPLNPAVAANFDIIWGKGVRCSHGA